MQISKTQITFDSGQFTRLPYERAAYLMKIALINCARNGHYDITPIKKLKIPSKVINFMDDSTSFFRVTSLRRRMIAHCDHTTSAV